MRFGQQQRELIAAETGEHIDLANVAAADLGQYQQRPIAHRMPIGIVDIFKPINIDQDQRQRTLQAPRAPDLQLRQFQEVTTVGRTSELIGVGLLLQRGLKSMALGNIDGITCQ